MCAKVEMVNLRVMGDSRGSLIALEKGGNVPFDVKRVYYIFNTQPNVSRGVHAHKQLKQLLIATSGSCTIRCIYSGEQKEITLDNPTVGLLIEGLVWREMHNFSKDCVLMVAASDYYSEDDYIRNFDEFIKESNNELFHSQVI